MGKDEGTVSADARRMRIVSELSCSDGACSGTALAKKLGVSRQVIVQDIALLRANGHEIVATNRGYVMVPAEGAAAATRRFII